MFGVHVACMPLHGMMEKVVDSLISSTPYIHMHVNNGGHGYSCDFYPTYIALALELLHGQLRYYWGD